MTKTWRAVPDQPTSLFPKPVAPDGKIWVCALCGKTAMDIYEPVDGWDESCMLNAVLCFEDPE